MYFSHRHLCVYSRHERNVKINIFASVLSVENKYPVLQVTEIDKSVPPQVENKYSGLTKTASPPQNQMVVPLGSQ